MKDMHTIGQGGGARGWVEGVGAAEGCVHVDGQGVCAAGREVGGLQSSLASLLHVELSSSDIGFEGAV